MTPDKIERVFGRGRLKMVTGEHVEVFREAVLSGERRRYTKRFLETGDADFRQWTQREWRILARLIGHGVRCVPDVVQFDGGMTGGMRQVQTYDAGVTVDQWATLLPVAREGAIRRHIFEDCGHWWALAHHCLAALEEIHRLQLVHLDIKADNICIPYDPASFDPLSPGARLYPAFTRLALIDFAFSLVSREPLATALPLGWQKDYDYQSPRLLRALEAGLAGELRPTQELDWRCDLYSLAAMLRRYLPEDEWARSQGRGLGWTAKRYEAARSLIYRLRECHDRDVAGEPPHAELMQITGAQLAAHDLGASLAAGWLLAHGEESASASLLATPMTRIAAPRTAITPAPVAPTALTEVPAVFRSTRVRVSSPLTEVMTRMRPVETRSTLRRTALAAAFATTVVGASILLGHPEQYEALYDAARATLDDRPKARQAPAEATPERVASVPASEAPERVASGPAKEAPERVASVPTSEAVERVASVPAREAVVDEPGTPASREDKAAVQAAAAGRQGNERDPDAPRSSNDAPGDATTSNDSPQAPTPAVTTPAETPAAPVESQATPPARAPAPIAVPPPLSKAESKPAPGASVPSGKTSAHGGKKFAGAAAQQHKPPAVTARASSTPPAHSRVAAAQVVPTPSKPPAANVDLTAAAKATQALVDASTASGRQPATSMPVQVASASAAPITDVAPAPTPPTSAANVNAASVAAGASEAPPVTITRPEPRRARTPPAPAPVEPWRAALRDMLTAFGVHEQPPAPVEERNVLASSASRAASRPPPSPQVVRGPVETRAIEPAGPAAPAVITAPLDPPERVADVGTRAAPVITARASVAAAEEKPDLLLLQARRLIGVDVPRIAAQAQNDIANVLWTAAAAEYPAQDRAVRNAATGSWPSERAQVAASASSGRGHYLHANARQAFALGRDSEALDLAMQAFAANPRDPEIAGFLALLHLRVKPMQPEVARQLALYALASSGSSRSARVDEWNTFAVASALSGRDADATRALLAEVALTSDLDRSCRAALGAYSMYGERLRAPVQAMIYRVQAQGRDRDSTACRWGGTRPVRYAGADHARF